MGLITTLIREHEAKKQQDFEKHLGLYAQVAGLPNASDELKQWAWHGIAQMSGEKLDIPKKHHGAFGQLLAGLGSLNPMPKDQYQGQNPLPKEGQELAPEVQSKVQDANGKPMPNAPAYQFRSLLSDQEVADKQAQAERSKFEAQYGGQYAAERTAVLQSLKDAGVDPTSPEGKTRLLGISGGTTRAAANPLSDDVIKARTGLAERLHLQEGTPEYDYLLATGKLPAWFGKPANTATTKQHTPTENEIYLSAYADKLGKDVSQLTGAERLKAIAEGKRTTHIASPSAGNGASPSDAKAIAGSIMGGKQPPTLTGLYRNAAGVRAELARQGFDLTRAELDWKAMERYIAVQNGDRQQRLRQATDFSLESLDSISGLSKEVSKYIPRTQYPKLNKAAIVAASNGAFGKEAATAANNLMIQIQDLQSELATVYKGGNSPTDIGLKQASEMLSANWDEDRLQSAVNLAKRNLGYRLNSIRNTGIVGLSPNSIYNDDAKNLSSITESGSATSNAKAGGGASGGSKAAGAPKTAAEFLKKHGS